MRGRSSSWCTGAVQSFALVSALAVLPGTAAHAKTWAKWAPSPLASDADYVAFAAKPADSLSAGQLAWLGVQREWRQEREEEASFATVRTTDAEAAYATPRGSDAGRLHNVRKSDERFATLAAQPYATLTAGDLAWMVSDLAARRAARAHSGDNGRAAGAVIVSVAIGALVTLAIVGAAFGAMVGAN